MPHYASWSCQVFFVAFAPHNLGIQSISTWPRPGVVETLVIDTWRHDGTLQSSISSCAQGRDLGFNTVLGFFSKLSSGTGWFLISQFWRVRWSLSALNFPSSGEQVLTRQAFRLGQVLHLPEADSQSWYERSKVAWETFMFLNCPIKFSQNRVRMGPLLVGTYATHLSMAMVLHGSFSHVNW